MLSVQILEPPAGQAVLAGFPLTVRVTGYEFTGGFLTGVGYVARRTSAGAVITVDSAAVRFPFSRTSTRDFSLTVPPSLETDTQIDVYGIAYGPGTDARLSNPSYVIVVQCTPSIPGCN